jgi:hypothetical protein
MVPRLEPGLKNTVLDIHEHGQKLWGGGSSFRKNLGGGVIKFSNFFSQICNNHRGYQNQLQNLIKNFQKY